MTPRLKVLICAYACSPNLGSEPGVGWGFVRALAAHHDLWVIVEEEKFRPDIERYLNDNPDFPATVRFHFIKKQRNRRLRRLWPPSYYCYYRRWHWDAFQLARGVHRQVKFDLAHQLTMVGFREPGYLWRLGVPFVWGPIGGMGCFPWRFLHKVGFYGAAYYLGYNLYNALQVRFLSRPREAAKAAGCGLISATPENRDAAIRFWQCESTVVPEVGLPAHENKLPSSRSAGEPLRMLWSGLHTHRKALNIALEALALIPAGIPWELHVLGSGRCTRSWVSQCQRLGLSPRCRFHGWVRREEALRLMAASHLFLITSLRDLTSTVTVEALASGLPVVCLDHCGFSHAVDDSCGIKVPVTRPDETIARLADAIRHLAGNEPARRELARGALKRAQAFSWENKVKILNHIYTRCVEKAAGIAAIETGRRQRGRRE